MRAAGVIVSSLRFCEILFKPFRLASLQPGDATCYQSCLAIRSSLRGDTIVRKMFAGMVWLVQSNQNVALRRYVTYIVATGR